MTCPASPTHSRSAEYWVMHGPFVTWIIKCNKDRVKQQQTHMHSNSGTRMDLIFFFCSLSETALHNLKICLNLPPPFSLAISSSVTFPNSLFPDGFKDMQVTEKKGEMQEERPEREVCQRRVTTNVLTRGKKGSVEERKKCDS